MSAKTKIVVLHRKQLFYTGILAALGIGLLLLLLNLSDGDSEHAKADPLPSSLGEAATSDTQEGGSDQAEKDLTATASTAIYIPGIYTTELVLGGQTAEVEVVLSADTIESIQLVNLSDAVTTMYPLLQPTFEDIREQIQTTGSVENILYSTDSKYTSLVLLEAIRNSVEKGTRPSDATP